MTKNRVKALAVLAAILAAFHVVAFVAPFTRGANFWVGYGFSLAAILLTAAVSFYAIGRKGTLRSKFYGLPLLGVIWRYLVVQLVCGVLFMVFAAIPTWIAPLISILLLAACVVGLIAVDAARDEVEAIDRKVEGKRFYLKSIQGELECLSEKMDDASLRKKCKELVETVKYSDPMSGDALAALETKIEAEAAGLQETVAQGDSAAAESQIAKLQALFVERNKKCKLMK